MIYMIGIPWDAETVGSTETTGTREGDADEVWTAETHDTDQTNAELWLSSGNKAIKTTYLSHTTPLNSHFDAQQNMDLGFLCMWVG